MQRVESLAAAPQGCVWALGNFDGVHQGHRQIITAAASLAQKLAAPCGILSFSPHPRRVLRPELPPFLLATRGQRVAAFARTGVDVCLLLPFTLAFAQTSANGFVTGILSENLQARGVVTGENFCFGHHRQGDAAMLAALCQAAGIAYQAVPVHYEGGAVCSSSQVRAAVQAGDMALATRLLGRVWQVEGVVEQGHQRGRTIGFPTANIAWPDALVRPRFGVYSVRVAGVPGIANIGVRPTVADGSALWCEVHLFQGDQDLYGQVLTVDICGFIRDEQRFPDLAALKAQIEQDCLIARKTLEQGV